MIILISDDETFTSIRYAIKIIVKIDNLHTLRNIEFMDILISLVVCM